MRLTGKWNNQKCLTGHKWKAETQTVDNAKPTKKYFSGELKMKEQLELINLLNELDMGDLDEELEFLPFTTQTVADLHFLLFF